MVTFLKTRHGANAMKQDSAFFSVTIPSIDEDAQNHLSKGFSDLLSHQVLRNQ
jgi:hypothetical protein